jgi:hypothetical protein
VAPVDSAVVDVGVVDGAVARDPNNPRSAPALGTRSGSGHSPTRFRFQARPRAAARARDEVADELERQVVLDPELDGLGHGDLAVLAEDVLGRELLAERAGRGSEQTEERQ